MQLRKNEIDRCVYVLEKGYVPEEIVWTIVVWAIVSAIQYLLISVFHWTAAIIVSLIAALLVSALVQGLKGFGGNGVNRRSGPSLDITILLFGVAIVTLNCLGVNELVHRWTGQAWNPYLLYGWLIVAIGGPITFGLIQRARAYQTLRKHSKEYVSIHLDVYHYQELFIYLEKVEFLDPKTGAYEEIVDLMRHFDYHPYGELKQEELSSQIGRSMNNHCQQSIYIPKDTNKFILSWYSATEDKYFSDEFVFKYERFAPHLKKLPYGTMNTFHGIDVTELNAIDIHIKSAGRVDLYTNQWLTFFYWDVAEVAITEEAKERYMNTIRQRLPIPGDKQNFLNEINKIVKSNRIEKRFEAQGKRFLWSMSLEGLGELTHSIDIDDTEFKHHRKSIDMLATPTSECLPEKITIFKRLSDELYFYFYVYIDRDQLYDCVQAISRGSAETPIHFDLSVGNRMKKEMTFTVTGNNNRIEFKYWQVNTTGT
ncbi:MFS transporter [Pseudochryseolinea flava]|uniref:Uncharacterized protein n=1 Tax=Pseudochryseolinea flava TaxID=2059302 RepID=A0A364Y7I0_9BACT|nr:hypothetical protein [Pseudochryseolinea flava]RAW02221.1 hypothetical protein DQQ10_06675 [Pseudochryseolinea flava]